MEVPPLMSWMEIVPPGGRWRAYFARRASIRREEVETLLEEGGGGGCVGAGRFLLPPLVVFVAIMVDLCRLSIVDCRSIICPF